MVAPPACEVDLYEHQALGQEMPARSPRNLGSAVQALVADGYLTRALGASLCNEFTRLKASEWELERYAGAF